MQQVCNIFLQFLAYSFLGWTCETIYCSIGQGKFVNRGFLNGPLCPVYGFGAMAVLVFLRPIQNNIPLLFLCGMLVTSVIEYITGYLLEKLFATKWWDYSTYRFNIHGRVCLRNSLMFGALSVVAARVVDPVVRGAIYSLPFWASVSMSAVLLVILLVDLVLTVRTILDINSVLRQFHQLVEQAKLDTAEYLRQSHQEFQQRFDQYQLNAELGRMELMDYIEQVKPSAPSAAQKSARSCWKSWNSVRRRLPAAWNPESASFLSRTAFSANDCWMRSRICAPSGTKPAWTV